MGRVVVRTHTDASSAPSEITPLPLCIRLCCLSGLRVKSSSRAARLHMPPCSMARCAPPWGSEAHRHHPIKYTLPVSGQPSLLLLIRMLRAVCCVSHCLQYSGRPFVVGDQIQLLAAGALVVEVRHRRQ